MKYTVRLFAFSLSLGLAAAVTFAGSAQAAGCPHWLAAQSSPSLKATRFADLCALYSASENAQARISRKLSPPEATLPHATLRLRGIFGPRLVNLSSDYLGAPGSRAHGDPWWIYAPKIGQEPTTEVFSKWQEAALWIEAQASENLKAAQRGELAGLTPVSEAALITIHTKAFKGLPDWGMDLPPDMDEGYRLSHSEFGYYFRGEAVLEHTFAHLKYPVDTQGVPTADARFMGEFHPLHCFDESPRELTDREEALVYPNGRRDAEGSAIPPVRKYAVLTALDTSPAFGFDSPQDGTDASGKPLRRQCGYFSFVDAPEIAARTARAISEMNLAFSQAYRPAQGPVGAFDPILQTARYQHWLVGIHPFRDGNGRTIRLVSDYQLLSLGLPTPIYWTTWADLNYTEKGWAEQVALGMERTVDVLEACADYLEGLPAQSRPLRTLGRPNGMIDWPLSWKDLCTVVPIEPTSRPW